MARRRRVPPRPLGDGPAPSAAPDRHPDDRGVDVVQSDDRHPARGGASSPRAVTILPIRRASALFPIGPRTDQDQPVLARVMAT